MNITIIGIGKLGLGLGLLLDKHGYIVKGVDINEKYIVELNNKSFCSDEPCYNELLLNSHNMTYTTDIEEGLNHADIIFIIVQTPLSGNDNYYDHSILSGLLSNINSYKVSNKHFIIGCTVMPKYIDTIGLQLIDDCNGCTLSYNPEFVAQGDVINGFQNPDIILIGSICSDLFGILKSIYDSIVKNKPKYCFMCPLSAEVVKICLNGYLTTKLSYANMIGDLCDTLDIDKDVVCNAIGSDSRIGNKYFKAGYSYGGPCFPRDTLAVKKLLDTYDISSDLLSATSDYNDYHIEFQAKQMLKEDKELYIFEDVSYKHNSNIPIIERSAKLRIAKYIANSGKTVMIIGNQKIITKVKEEYGNIFQYRLI
jgi:UDPglucose 6-dehydrogenase